MRLALVDKIIEFKEVTIEDSTSYINSVCYHYNFDKNTRLFSDMDSFNLKASKILPKLLDNTSKNVLVFKNSDYTIVCYFKTDSGVSNTFEELLNTGKLNCNDAYIVDICHRVDMYKVNRQLISEFIH